MKDLKRSERLNFIIKLQKISACGFLVTSKKKCQSSYEILKNKYLYIMFIVYKILNLKTDESTFVGEYTLL